MDVLSSQLIAFISVLASKQKEIIKLDQLSILITKS